jgi:glycerophosphoryl diester phosphodiesterase
MKYNLIRFLSSLVMVCVFFFSQVSQSQTTTHTYETKYKLYKAYGFKKPHGIKALHNTGWSKITIEVKTKNQYTFGNDTEHVTLYKAYILPTDAGTELKHRAESGSYHYYRNGFPGHGWQYRTNYTDSRDYYSRQAYAVDSKIATPSWGRWGHDNLDVIATVTIEGGGSLRDIDEIKVPGADPWDGGHFLNYTNPCVSNPSHPGCEAVADFKNVSNATNKKAIVVAHRGYHGMRGDFPENTLAAVKKAYVEGFRYVEVDLRMTKDNVPIIFHDDWLGYVTNYPTVDNNDDSTRTEENNWSDIKDYKYRERYWDRTYKTANNAGNQFLRLGNVVSTEKFNSFSQVCDYISGKDIMLYLDIKSVPTNKNLEVMRQCLFIAAEKNILHQIAVKVIRTNAGAPVDKQLIMTVATVEEQLRGIYHTLKANINIHVVDYSPQLGTSFASAWIGQGNVVGFEFDAANADGMFRAPALFDKIYPGGLCAWDYTKALGFRTGIWSSTAVDPRGRPGHDPSKWSTGNAMKLTPDQNNYIRYKDVRSRMEIATMISPQYITHDRPDTWVSYLNAIQLYNSKSKR